MFKKLFFPLLLLAAVSCSPDSNDKVLSPTAIPVELSTEEMQLFASSMLTEVNRLRAEGCTCDGVFMPSTHTLTWNSKLTSAADRHAYDMKNKNFFNHQGSDNSKVGDRTIEAGYFWNRVGENIAMINGEVKEAVAGWQSSPAHCKQMMSPDFSDLGAAKRGEYWVQVFGKIND